ncbi:MAG TPA: hypothetical protein VIQ24_05450 [Pyrinomonadaceae bacterium]
MSLIYLHGEPLLPFMLGLLAFAVLGWGALIYMLYKFWQKRKE